MALLLTSCVAGATGQETLPALKDGIAPRSFEELWAGSDPRAEPLETEVLHEWEEDGVLLRVLRYRIGVFKGQKAMMAAVYGYPIGGRGLPGLVQIHGGGQYADYRAPLYNAKRGYATISISWAGRITAPDYNVNPEGVKLFWDHKTDDPSYKPTTDWGALDAYHAPARNPGSTFLDMAPHPWTLDDVESPRNNPWFLCALAARRALTFLEQQPEVDADKLGVYGHSMGGKLTVMAAAADSRVKAAAPSCGGISDRHSDNALYRATIGDDVYLSRVACPIIFLSPSNDFHGRIDDLSRAVQEIPTGEWRLTCSAHHNHQDTEPHQVAGPLWFDQHLKGTFAFPDTPEAALKLQTEDGVPRFTVTPDASQEILSVDIYYTQQGRSGEAQASMDNAIHRFWHHAEAQREGATWRADLPLLSTDAPLWVYANVRYPLDDPVSGAGYYYAPYTARTFNLSSAMHAATPAEFEAAGVRATASPSLVIETFKGKWEKEWFTYDLSDNWARRTHKIHDDTWRAPAFAKLAFDARCAEPNKMVVGVGEFAAEAQLEGGPQWQHIVLYPTDFHDAVGRSLLGWDDAKDLRLGPAETLRSGQGDETKTLTLGAEWQGPKPEFGELRWVEGTSEELNVRRTVKLPKGDDGPTYLTDEYADALKSLVPARMDTDMLGEPLTVDGKTYEHGMSVRAPSKATFFLGGEFTKLHAIAAAGPGGTVVFQVTADGETVFDSGLLAAGEHRVVDLSVSGAQEVQLIVTDGGNGQRGDWAHWVDAWVESGTE